MEEDPDTDDDIVPVWLQRLADGDEGAARDIWNKYFGQLVTLARRRLGGLPRRIADEEDIAASAMGSFYRGVKDGRYTQLGGPNFCGQFEFAAEKPGLGWCIVDRVSLGIPNPMGHGIFTLGRLLRGGLSCSFLEAFFQSVQCCQFL